MLQEAPTSAHLGPALHKVPTPANLGHGPPGACPCRSGTHAACGFFPPAGLGPDSMWHLTGRSGGVLYVACVLDWPEEAPHVAHTSDHPSWAPHTVQSYTGWRSTTGVDPSMQGGQTSLTPLQRTMKGTYSLVSLALTPFHASQQTLFFF